MFSKLHERLGTAGLVIAVVALIAALSGSAIAAGKFITKPEAIKIAKQYSGKRGPRGAAGPAGPAGPTGPAGVAGAKGDKGDTGSAGPEGKQGQEGPEGPEGKEGEEGPEGLEGKEGKEGPEGKEGEPWSVGGVLPSGKTETGVWSFAASTSTGEELEIEEGVFVTFIHVPLSIPIPLPGPIPVPKIKVAPDSNCTGNINEPAAAPGYLCIYPAELVNAEFTPGLPGIPQGKAGAFANFFVTGDNAAGRGSFAVTAP